jgi:L,D-transpeptidase YbiS
MRYSLEVDIAKQSMTLFDNGAPVKTYSISTAKNGAGEIMNSEMTPRGKHVIRAKIGDGAPENAVFVKRRQTGEIYSLDMREQFPNRDWILTRIFWLCGLEPGKNRFGKVDTMRRYIYIHGTPDDVAMGAPGSRGCIRMRNSELIELFNTVPSGTRIEIK